MAEGRQTLTPIRPSSRRRRRLLTRAAPILLVAVAAFVAGLLAGAGNGDDSAGQRFADAWTADDLEAMYAELSPAARRRHSLEDFRRAYRRVARTATAETVRATRSGEATTDDGRVEIIAAAIETRAFAEVRGDVELPVSDEGVEWAPHHAFPGLAEGEVLTRRTRAPERGPIVAADGTALAEGPVDSRSLTLGQAAAAVVGEVGEAPPAVERELEARGFPPGTPTGISGLELAYDDRLAGIPGGRLIAGASADAPPGQGRVLATTEPRDGRPVRTTIDPVVQEAAVNALGGLYGGIAVLDARRGAVRGLAGVAFTAPQPPGSTFKVITAVAALDEGVVEPEDEFPVETSNSEIGREISNSNESACGGTFRESFAKSCNTVFAPVGAEVGAEALVETAERFGFNSEPTLHDAEATAAIDPPASTLPTDISGAVEVGVSAIGQGEVLATPLLMASIAQTIANDGVRMPTPMVRGSLAAEAEPVEVTSPRTAKLIQEMMVEVVRSGTGTAAALPDVQVAGKTGTAELGPAAAAPADDPDAELEQELDAWFIAYAPARDPELAVAVMIVNAEGDGGAIAAPIARQVLDEAL